MGFEHMMNDLISLNHSHRQAREMQAEFARNERVYQSEVLTTLKSIDSKLQLLIMMMKSK